MMRRMLVPALAVMIAFFATKVITAQAPVRRAAAPTKAVIAPAITDRAREADEKAVRAAAAAFAQAYNAHDARALADLFTHDGELVDASGDAQQGRERVGAVFTAVFDEYPEATMAVRTTAVRFLGTGLAEEDGVASVVHEPGLPAEDNRYTALYIRQDGKWLLASARDLPDAHVAPTEKLKPLAGLIGDWIDESPDSLITTSYRWTDNQCFILGEFNIQIAGRPVMSGSQRIGWDPVSLVIRSWVFDSEGGFAEGVYARDGQRWVINLNGVTREGEPAAATNVITFISKDRLSWQSRDRMVGGRTTIDTPEVIMVRPPPKPK